MTFFEERWWVFVLRGLAAMLFGGLCFAMPGIGLLALTTLVAVYFIFDGVSALAAVGPSRRAGGQWGWLAFEGLCGLAAGIGAWVMPGMTALALLFIIAAWSVAVGLARIALAIVLRKELEGEWLLVLSGLLSIGFGAIVAIRPGAGALAIVWTIGAYAIIVGALLFGVGLKVHGVTRRRSEPPMTPA